MTLVGCRLPPPGERPVVPPRTLTSLLVTCSPTAADRPTPTTGRQGVGPLVPAHDLRALYLSEMLEQKRDPNTHKNPQTMRTVYDRRKTIKVTPLA